MTVVFKPNIAFLRKVEAGGVKLVRGYTARRGGYNRFIGGEATARAHAEAGYIEMPLFADLGRPALATLTDAGRAALASV